LILLAVSLPSVLSSQTAFDVASIKENTAPGDGGSLRLMPAAAFRRGSFESAIDAKPAEKATRDQIFVMLQGRLVDRFTLAKPMAD